MVLNLKEILASEREHHRIVLEKERTQSLDLKKEIETMKVRQEKTETMKVRQECFLTLF